MAIGPLSIREDYWETFEIKNQDLDFLYNYLLETEIPLNSREVVNLVVQERIRQEKINLESQKPENGALYVPKGSYTKGQTLTFPALDWMKGEVIGVREGKNPSIPPFEVIDVMLADGERKSFAAKVEDHSLNQPISIKLDDPLLDSEYVLSMYGKKLTQVISRTLKANPDLVCVAEHWFPKALLVDINVGHLNLAEAILEMSGGSPMPTNKLLEQIDLPEDINPKLIEFSFNIALQKDKENRFDEVGPTGEVLWCLRRLEPQDVQNTPKWLQYTTPTIGSNEYQEEISQFGRASFDEFSPQVRNNRDNEVSVILIFPHWRSGTLPLTENVADLLPTAIESQRVQFLFVDGDTGEKFPGWVVRPKRYVSGLREWYLKNKLIPGSQFTMKAGKNPGEIQIFSARRKPTREWIRTAMIGSDGKIVFAMLKQPISTDFDDRMAIAISDYDALDQIWDTKSRQNIPLDIDIKRMMLELAKLSPQSHVHAQELYAAINTIRRCPPTEVIRVLLNNPWAIHSGDLYFRLEEDSGTDG
ncbi:MAG TPA: hypothetical protein VIO61_11600 [Anaerolineaceae bacterium]